MSLSKWASIAFRKILIEQFFVQIDKVTHISNTLGISIFDIPEIIEREKRELARLDELILINTKEISRQIVEEGITKKDGWI
jgi:hypothetical protein